MHPRNRYAAPHDLPRLARVVPALAEHFTATPDGRTSLDFTNPVAVRLLNRALLLRDFGLTFWDLPPEHLCPAVPGRLDYVHAVADLLAGHPGAAAAKTPVTGLDIGTGASLVYPILGVGTYGWRFVASEVDPAALRAAGAIARLNPALAGRVELRRQARADAIFDGVVRPQDRLAFTMCNPPFFASAAEADAAARAKWTKLGVAGVAGADGTGIGGARNFGGRAHELWTAGGEPAFLRRMLGESPRYGRQVGWFTTLVSQAGYLATARRELRRLGAAEVRVVELVTGAKRRRVLAWRFT